MAAGKRKRTHRVSKGENGAGGKMRNLTEVQKVNMGRGLDRTFKPVGSPSVKPKVETARKGIAAIASARKAAA